MDKYLFIVGALLVLHSFFLFTISQLEREEIKEQIQDVRERCGK